jgi:multiple sugar transport system permease protein
LADIPGFPGDSIGRSEPTGRGLLSFQDFNRPRIRYGYVLLLLFLTTGAAITIFPFVWMFFSALKDSNEVFRIPPTLLPRSWQWSNFVKGWGEINLVRYFSNTIKIMAGTWFMAIIMPSLAAYSLSKMRPAFGNVVLLGFMATLMMPSQAYLIPRFLVLQKLPLIHVNLLDSYWALWLPAIVQPFNIMLLKNFFDRIPTELIESARIDGAAELRIFGQIVFPLSKPIIAVLSIFTINGVWNDFFWPMIVISTQAKQPIMVAVQLFSKGTSSMNVVMAVLFMVSVPPLVVFLVFQRFIIGGMTLGSLKG